METNYNVSIPEVRTVTLPYIPDIKEDMINSPSHYAEGRNYEPIDVIEDWDLDFCLGNALKYISRAGRKDPTKEIEDLKKSVYYINRKIEQLERK